MPLDAAAILNCGCGGSFEAEFLAEQRARVIGFDISPLRVKSYGSMRLAGLVLGRLGNEAASS